MCTQTRQLDRYLIANTGLKRFVHNNHLPVPYIRLTPDKASGASDVDTPQIGVLRVRMRVVRDTCPL